MSDLGPALPDLGTGNIEILYDVMTAPVVRWRGKRLPPIYNTPDGPFPAGTRPRYEGQMVDRSGTGVSLGVLATFTITVVDTLTGEIINSAYRVDALNTGRGLVNDDGSFAITLDAADTSMDNVPGEAQVQRSLVIEWSTNDVPPEIGRHQRNFMLVRLAA